MTFFDYIWLERFSYFSFLPKLYFIECCRTHGRSQESVNDSHTRGKHHFRRLKIVKCSLCTVTWKEQTLERGERSRGCWKGKGRETFLQLRQETGETWLERNKNWDWGRKGKQNVVKQIQVSKKISYYVLLASLKRLKCILLTMDPH